MDSDALVWRYLDLGKFIALLYTNSLYLSRSDLLNDRHEGTITKINMLAREQQAAEIGSSGLIGLDSNGVRMVRLSTFINCWHMANGETDAMWKLYCPSSCGVAIQSTYRKLSNCSPDPELYIGLVRYIDYESDFIPRGNLFNPFMYKRKAFEHEHEVRIIKNVVKYYENTTVGVFDEEKMKVRVPSGIEINVHLENLIDKVYVSPYAADWYFKMIESVISKYSPTLLLKWSTLKSHPIF